jgi:hypothetical protein
LERKGFTAPVEFFGPALLVTRSSKPSGLARQSSATGIIGRLE